MLSHTESRQPPAKNQRLNLIGSLVSALRKSRYKVVVTLEGDIPANAVANALFRFRCCLDLRVAEA